MRPVIVSSSGVSVSSPVVLDYFQNPFSVGLGCVVTGSATYTVQHSFDDPYSATGLVNWFAHDDVALVNATTSQNGNLAFPVRAVRINQTVGAGSVAMTVIQSGAGKG